MANENTPFVPATAGEPITAGKWNRVQTELRNELHAHRHTGQWSDGLFDGPPIGTAGLEDAAITTAKLADQSVTGDKVDPGSTLVVKALRVSASGMPADAVAGRFDGPLLVNVSGSQAFKVDGSLVSVTQGLRVGGSIEGKLDLTIPGAASVGALSVSNGIQTDSLLVSASATLNGGLKVVGGVEVTGDVTLYGRNVIRIGPKTAVSSGTVTGVLGFLGYGVKHGQIAYRAGYGFELVDVSSGAPSVDYDASRPNVPIKTGTLTAIGNSSVTGTLTVSSTLTAQGDVIMGGNGVKISSSWSNYPGGGTNQAEISNDTGAYKALMIVGNRSGAGTTRRVGMWDDVTVAGKFGIGMGSTTTPEARLHVVGGGDASLSSHGYVVVGATNGTNICIDDNEIMARNNGSASTLHLNANGGTVRLGDQATCNLSVNGSLTCANGDNLFQWNGAADVNLRYKPRGNGGRAIVHDGGNVLTINYAGDFAQTRVYNAVHVSSRTQKDEIRQLDAAEARALVEALTPSGFVWRNDEERRPTYGFIAEEVPDTVGPKDKMGVDPLAILAGVTRTVQSLLDRIDSLEAQLAEARAT